MVIKLLLILIILLIAFNNKGIPAFLYHNIDENSNVTPELFEEHLKILKSNNMNTIKIEQLFEKNIPYKSSMITMDDGYVNNYTNVYPLLKKYNMKATIFLNTAYIGKNEKYMNWDQIKEMHESNVIDFQCHSHTHNYVFVDDKIIGILTGHEDDHADAHIYGSIKEGYPVFKKRGEYSSRAIIINNDFYEVFREFYLKELKNTPKNQLLKKAQEFININKEKYFHEETKEEFENKIKREFLLNKKAIEEHLGKKVTFFCWPWGHRGKEAMKVLEAVGVKGFVTTRKGTNSYKPDFHMIKRIELRDFTANKFKINLLICKNLLLGKIYSLLS
ncbi:polysaccharide deacetylase family protein [Fusobacterium sp. PH5-44]|uniref:polysaccharide deacetylase family protein n=1 Tax=unclassified Fusobacterium TaxID=2648384 RepID=UPI003D1F0CAF